MPTVGYVLLNFMYDKYTMVNTWKNEWNVTRNYTVNTYSQLKYVVKWFFYLVAFQNNARILVSSPALKPIHLPNKRLSEFFPEGKRSGCYADH